MVVIVKQLQEGEILPNFSMNRQTPQAYTTTISLL